VFGRLKEQPSPQSLVGTTRPLDDESYGSGGGGSGGGHHGPRGPSEGLILLAFVLLTLFATGFNLARQEHDAVHDPAQKAARGEVKGLSKLSLLREENFRKVLAKVSASKHPLVINVRVSAVRADFTVRNEDGYRKLYSFDTALKNTVRDWGVGEDDTLAVQQIDAGAPERMVRTVEEKAGVSADAVDYVTMSAPITEAAERTWYMSLDRGPARVRQWVAEPDGSDLRKPGELSQKQKSADRKRKRDFERQQRQIKRNIRRRVACFTHAQTAEDAARCSRRFP
jgi:hypothetical protein